MKITILIFFALVINYQSGFTQLIVQEQKNENAITQNGICIPQQERDVLNVELQKNISHIMAQGKLHLEKAAHPKFKWPLKQVGTKYKYYYSIIQYVDHDPLINFMQDYHCDSRTYDGHRGVDIMLWPFPWKMMDEEKVSVVAAAAGTIISKRNGKFDQNCTWNINDTANSIVLLHSDGSKSYYWHLKKGSLTSKTVGMTVSAGELLGKVGSSGYSNVPHLHFEVEDQAGNLIDPYYLGPLYCNTWQTDSWWQSQLEYYDSHLNYLTIGNKPPLYPTCPQIESPNEDTLFSRGDSLYFSSYYHDVQPGQVAKCKIIKPDNTNFKTWNINFTQYNRETYKKKVYYVSSDMPMGVWKYECIFNNDTIIKNFIIGGFDCSNAIAINCGVKKTSNVSSGFSTLTKYPTPFKYNLPGKEKIFKYTTTVPNDTIAIHLHPLGNKNLSIAVFSGCDTNHCLTATYSTIIYGGNYDRTLYVNNVPSGTYFIVVDGLDSIAPFEIYLLSSKCGGFRPGPFTVSAYAYCEDGCGFPNIIRSWTASANSTLTSGSDTIFDKFHFSNTETVYQVASNVFASTTSNYDTVIAPCVSALPFIALNGSYFCEDNIYNDWWIVNQNTLPDSINNIDLYVGGQLVYQDLYFDHVWGNVNIKIDQVLLPDSTTFRLKFTCGSMCVWKNYGGFYPFNTYSCPGVRENNGFEQGNVQLKAYQVAEGEIKISITNNIRREKFVIILTDLTGREVYRRETVSDTERLDLKNLNTGIYLVRLLGTNTMNSKKILINNN